MTGLRHFASHSGVQALEAGGVSQRPRVPSFRYPVGTWAVSGVEPHLNEQSAHRASNTRRDGAHRKSARSPQSRPESRAFLALLRWIRPVRVRFEPLKVSLFHFAVLLLHRSDSPGRPILSPLDAIPRDPVVRAARKAPAPDGRIEGHGLAVKDQPPVRRRERRDNLLTTATATAVNDSPVGNGHVENALRQSVGDELDELMLENAH